MHTRRQLLARTGLAAMAAALAARASAQAFPSRPIRFIVPFPAGGTAEALARVVGEHMTRRWGQPVIVEARPGGGTVIGMQQAARAPADGHTIVFISNSFVINAKLRNNLPYDGMKAFEPVASMFDSPQVIAVHADSPYTTLASYLDAARARSGSLSLGSLGPATAQHIAAEMLQRAAGVRLIYTAFAGDPPAINAVLGRHVDAVLANANTLAPHLGAGKLRALAVTTGQRLDALRDVPTVAESGHAGFEAVAWFGVAAPVGTPADVVARLAEGIGGAVADPEVLKSPPAFALKPGFMTPRGFAAHIAQQYEHYSRVIDEAGIKGEG